MGGALGLMLVLLGGTTLNATDGLVTVVATDLRTASTTVTQGGGQALSCPPPNRFTLRCRRLPPNLAASCWVSC